jgi:hypothetical protein
MELLTIRVIGRRPPLCQLIDVSNISNCAFCWQVGACMRVSWFTRSSMPVDSADTCVKTRLRIPIAKAIQREARLPHWGRSRLCYNSAVSGPIP